MTVKQKNIVVIAPADIVQKYLGVNQSTYSDYENGKINVPVEILMKLADYYHVSLDYLTGRTDEKK